MHVYIYIHLCIIQYTYIEYIHIYIILIHLLTPGLWHSQGQKATGQGDGDPGTTGIFPLDPGYTRRVGLVRPDLRGPSRVETCHLGKSCSSWELLIAMKHAKHCTQWDKKEDQHRINQLATTIYVTSN